VSRWDGGKEQINKQSCRSEDWEVCYNVCVCVSLSLSLESNNYPLKYKEKYSSTVFGSVKYIL
jgi:hypothetical protein